MSIFLFNIILKVPVNGWEVLVINLSIILPDLHQLIFISHSLVKQVCRNAVKTVYQSNVTRTFYVSPLCALQQIKPTPSKISVLLFKTSTDAHTWALIPINENVKGSS